MKRITPYLFIFFFITASGQNILYVFPDKTEAILKDKIDSLKRNGNSVVFHLCHSIKSDSIDIYLRYFNSENDDYYKKDVFVHNTNRFILVGDERIPVVFDYDYRFGTTTCYDEIGNFPCREGTYARIALILHQQPIVVSKGGNLKSKPLNTRYKVLNYKKRKKVYIIYAKKDESVYKIYSYYDRKKDKSMQKIKKGNYYSMSLFPYFKLFEEKCNMLLNNEIVISYHGIKLIREPERGINDIYFSPELNGLYIVK